jgi:hypothetical protein
MRGIPKDLDLSKFKDNLLDHISICQHQISFVFFEPRTSITAMGRWELKDDFGKLVDGSNNSPEYAKRDACYCNKILGKAVKRLDITAPYSISFSFESGHVLTIFDDLGPYECIQIQPGDIYF